MSTELTKLVDKWKKDLKLRDQGAKARSTWQKIKEVATPEEQVQILEEQFMRTK